MQNTTDFNAQSRSRFLAHAQTHQIDASSARAPIQIQSTWHPSVLNLHLRYARDIQTQIEQNGVNRLSDWIRRSMEQWQHEEVRIALTGASGVGKSTAINSMLNLTPNDPRAAKTSSRGQCTIDIKEYRHPRNPNLILIDLPGIGTTTFPRETYAADVKLSSYDFVIILTHERFTEDQNYLAHELEKLKKKFFFVRTRIDESIENEKEDQGERFDEGQYIEEIRRTVQESLSNFPNATRIFVISGRLRNATKWDFPELVETLINSAPDIKREALIHTFVANSRAAIEAKAVLLEQRAFFVAMASAGVAAIPVPGLSICCDVLLITGEIRKYMTEFGLDPASMDVLAKTFNVSCDDLQKLIFGNSAMISSENTALLTTTVTSKLHEFAMANIPKEYTRYIPFVGQAISSAISFGVVLLTLHHFLNEVKMLAIERINQIHTLAI